MLKQKSLIRITIVTVLFCLGAIDTSKAQWSTGDRNPNPTDIIFLGDTENFDSTVLIIPLFEGGITLDNNPPTPLPSYPPGVRSTPVLICPAQQGSVERVAPSPCPTLARLATLPSSGIGSGKCEMKIVLINITALQRITTQSNEKLIQGTPINISSVFDSATQNSLGINSSRSQSWQYLRPSPDVGYVCQIPWPPIWSPPLKPPTPTPTPSTPPSPTPTPTPSSSPECTDLNSCKKAPEPTTILGMGIGVFGLGLAYKKKKKLVKVAKFKNDSQTPF